MDKVYKMLRISEEAHAQARQLAKDDLRSIAGMIEYLIQQEFRRRYGLEKGRGLAEVPHVEKVVA